MGTATLGAFIAASQDAQLPGSCYRNASPALVRCCLLKVSATDDLAQCGHTTCHCSKRDVGTKNTD